MKKLLRNIVLAVVVLGVLGIGYYTLSPLFITVVVDDALPITQTEEEGEEMGEVPLVYAVVDTPSHRASGTLSVIEDGAKSYIRYENYTTVNGPDLFVYLSKDLEATDFVSLGEIRGTDGNINYEVPEGVSLNDYRYVLTWCKQFGVLFNYVDLTTGVPMSGDEAMMKDGSGKEMMDDEASPTIEGSSGTLPVTEGEGVSVRPFVPVPPVVDTTPKTAVMGTGCFWCVEHDFEEVEGVTDVVSGYAGGTNDNPSYENYAEGGHREVVLVTYDPRIVSYGNLVEHTIKYGDPTDSEGSFGDRGKYYAPAIYYENDSERDTALEVIRRIDALTVYPKPVDIAVLPRSQFWEAEAYHQNYAEKNPIRYNFYRKASGRTAFIEKYWGESAGEFIASGKPSSVSNNTEERMQKPWESFIKPSDEELTKMLTTLEYDVTQEEGTERSGTSELDKNFEPGIYVDIVSGEPLYSSRDKFDSGTGWPSFVKPIEPDAVTLREDKKLFSTRTEVRSRYADSHIGHVFDDGPADRGGMRYCMNGAALRFIPKAEMEKEGSPYQYLLDRL